MNALFSALCSDAAVHRLTAALAEPPHQLAAHGFSGSLKHAAIAAAYDQQPRPMAVVAAGREALRAWQEDLTALLPEADIYELPELAHIDFSAPGFSKSMERSARRMDILARLLRHEPIIVLAEIGAAVQKGLSAAEFTRCSLLLRLGDTLAMETLLERVTALGYEHGGSRTYGAVLCAWRHCGYFSDQCTFADSHGVFRYGN